MSQTIIDVAKASVVAYNEKDWDGGESRHERVRVRRGCHESKAGWRPDVIAAWKGWATALPDSEASFEAAYGSGNTVTLELTWRGTQSGPLQTATGNIPATGRKINVRAAQIVELTPEGKTKRVRHYFDMATLLAQLGVNAVGV